MVHTYKPFSQGKTSENEFWKSIIQDTGSLMQIPNKSLLMNAYRENFTMNEEMIYLLKTLKNKVYNLPFSQIPYSLIPNLIKHMVYMTYLLNNDTLYTVVRSAL